MAISQGNMTDIVPPAQSHFVCIKTVDMSEFPVSSKFLMNSYITISEKANKTSFVKDFEVEATYCKMQMSKESR